MSRHLSHAVVVVLLAIASACNSAQNNEWLVASEDTLVIGVEINGMLKATDSVSVGPPPVLSLWEFKISAMAPDGEIIKEGDMVVTFDGSSLQEQLLSKENKRDETQVKLAKQRQEISLFVGDENLKISEAEAALRKATLAAEQSDELTSNLILRKAKLDLHAAQETLDHLRSQKKRNMSNHRRNVVSLETTVSEAERDVKELGKEIQSMTVLATRSGTTIHNERWDGEKNKVGDSLWRMQMVMEIASLDSMMAEGFVDEADMAKLSIGQRVRLRLEAHPDSEVLGTLTEIGRTVQRKSREIPSKVVAIKLSVQAVEGLQLRPGMRFRGEVESERIENTLILPLSAVFSSRSGPIAFRKTESGVKRVQLELGKSGKRSVQVLKGLKAGDKVSARDLSRGME